MNFTQKYFTNCLLAEKGKGELGFLCEQCKDYNLLGVPLSADIFRARTIFSSVTYYFMHLVILCSHNISDKCAKMSGRLFKKGTNVVDFLHKFCEEVDISTKKNSWTFKCIRDNENNKVYVLCKFRPGGKPTFNCMHAITTSTNIDKMTTLLCKIILELF